MEILGANNVASTTPSSGLKLWDNGDLPSFSDILDFINPLQQLPVISNLYQQETGDTMGAIAKIGGATLLGGPIGGIAALANEVLEATTGHDVAGHVMGFMGMGNNSNGKTEVVIPSPQEDAQFEPAAGNINQDKIRTTTKEWIYGISA